MEQKREFIVTVTTEHYLDVTARDADHARHMAERTLATEFGKGRSARVSKVEAA